MIFLTATRSPPSMSLATYTFPQAPSPICSTLQYLDSRSIDISGPDQASSRIIFTEAKQREINLLVSESQRQLACYHKASPNLMWTPSGFPFLLFFCKVESNLRREYCKNKKYLVELAAVLLWGNTCCVDGYSQLRCVNFKKSPFCENPLWEKHSAKSK